MKYRLKELRKKLDLSGDEFGKKIGVTRMAVSKMETGRQGITEQTVKSICREFDVNEEWLREGVGDMFVEPSLDEQIVVLAAELIREDAHPLKKKAIEQIIKISPDGWDAIEEIIIELSKGIQKRKEQAEEHPQKE